MPKANVSTESFAYLSEEDSGRVVNQFPNCELKVLIKLSHWGGLRVGSEVRELKWSDIDWTNQKMKVTSPKTERYAGYEFRIVPLLPELRVFLEEHRRESAKYEMKVLPMLNGRSDASLRKYLLGEVKRSGYLMAEALAQPAC